MVSKYIAEVQSIHAILKDYWGYDSFRPFQEEIINSVLKKNDTLALLPTGGGKSICFQVPSLAEEGICLVISPLIALMKDQVENLKKKNILAAAIYTGMSRRQIVQTLKNLAYGPYKFLYVSPERLSTDLFLEYLPALNVNLIAVDEAHCISQWGYDFRPSYLKISELRKELPRVPVLALTASATPQVQKDICEKLGEPGMSIFRQSFIRKNLSYSVFRVDSKMNKLVDILSKVSGSAIVYCKSRRRTQEITQLLQLHGISAQNYHAGLTQEVRNQRQEEWIANKVKTIVCTNAFGMGIDKPDVRAVVHADTPDCLENYYQEAGRAGRDEKRSYAVLLYDERDLKELSELHEQRYPSFEEIQKTYEALCNYLQIHLNSGQDISYNFRFEEFVKNFKLDASTTLYALKALEGDGWLHFNEKSFSPSGLVFTTSKEALFDFQKNYPEFEPLLTTLLRTYEGIFDFAVPISELLIAKLLKQHLEEIKTSLRKIHAFGIINYTPQNEEPQIIFKKNRVLAEHLSFNHAFYKQRKDIFIDRVKKMVAYTKTTECRNVFINNYFGDADKTECGICDNCLSKKPVNISEEEFNQIQKTIFAYLNNAPISSSDLLVKLKGIQKEKARRVIHFLQAEQKISINQKGEIILN